MALQAVDAFVGWAGIPAASLPFQSGRLAGPAGQETQDFGLHSPPSGAGRMIRCDTPAATAIVIGHIHWRDSGLREHARISGDASALLQAYERHGMDTLRHLAGQFAVAVVDKGRRSALLATDRFGSEALYYSIRPHGGLLFGGSADGLCRLAGLGDELNTQALYDYLYFHMIPSPGTLYRDIAKLEPGQCLRYENGRAATHYHWQPQFIDAAPASLDALKEELAALLDQAVARCRGGNRVGAFLSGGLDSSTVAGFLARQRSPERTDTYSIGFAATGYDEMEYARAAGERFGLHMHEYYVTPDDVAEAMPLIAQAYDEPFGNSSAVPTLFCARMAKNDGTDVLLAGDGGDEIFAGNARYVKQKIFGFYAGVPSALRSGLVEPLLLHSPLGSMPLLSKLRSYVDQARLPMPDRMESYNFLRRTPAATVFTPDFLAAVDTTHPLEHLRAVYRRSGDAGLIDRMLHLDWKITLADNDLRKVGRMCELAGITVRYPMLDDDLVDFSLRVPATLKIRGLKLRHFYKEAMKGFLPDKIIAKTKHGFGLPFGEWLRESPALAQLVGDSLAGLRKRNIVRNDFIDALLDRHRDDHAAYYGSMIWVLAMLELWLDRHRRPAAGQAALAQAYR